MIPRLPEQRLVVDDGGTWREKRPEWLYRGILLGSHVDVDAERGDEVWPVRLIHLGSIDLPDGRLVACDPYVADAQEQPFSTRLRPGSHDVFVARSTVGPGHERNAAAIILSTGAVVRRWEMAVTAAADIGTLESGDSYFGYGVDAGTGCFASPEAQRAATATLGADGGMLEDALSLALLSAPLEAVVAAPSAGEPSLAVFQTGWGDGYYPTWLGIDEAGEVSVVVTDFLLADDPFTRGDDQPVTATPKEEASGSPLRRVVGALLRPLRRSGEGHRARCAHAVVTT